MNSIGAGVCCAEVWTRSVRQEPQPIEASYQLELKVSHPVVLFGNLYPVVPVASKITPQWAAANMEGPWQRIIHW